jgi:hypothetical protein
MKKEEIIKDIVAGIVGFKIIPFFGAGMSLNAGASSWHNLIAELRNELNTDEADYLAVGSLYEKAHGRQKLVEKLKGACTLKKIDSTSLENHMRILAMNPPIIYTTNYDVALEEATRLLLKDYRKIVTLKNIVDAPHGARQIIKFHGDFSFPESIVFTREDYDKRMDMKTHPLDITFRKDMLGKGFLFLGYGLGDVNINTILQKHKEWYGTENMPKSYIITFEPNSEREQELESFNVITLILKSPSELATLIDEISNKVFNTSINEDINQLLKPVPSEVLTSFEIDQLYEFIKSDAKTPPEKHDKFRNTVDSKSISLDDEDRLALLFQEIITGNYAYEIKNGAALSFPHTQFRKTKNVLAVAFDLVALAANDKFRFNFRDFANTDVLLMLEMKLSDCFKPKDAQKIFCAVVLGYLEGMMLINKKLEFDHVDRLLEALKNNRYDEFELIGPKYTPEVIKTILNHYFNQLGNTLKARFEFPSLVGKGNNIAEIKQQIMAQFPKGMM